MSGQSFEPEAWRESIQSYQRRVADDLKKQIESSRVAIETSWALLREIERRFPEIDWAHQTLADFELDTVEAPGSTAIVAPVTPRYVPQR